MGLATTTGRVHAVSATKLDASGDKERPIPRAAGCGRVGDRRQMWRFNLTLTPCHCVLHERICASTGRVMSGFH